MILILFVVIHLIAYKNGLYYVGATDKLPEPLSKEAEEFYLVMAQDGDQMAKDKLIEHNLRLVVFLAKNMKVQKWNLKI